MNDISEPAIPPAIAHLYTKQASVRNDYVNYFDYSSERGIDNPSHFPILVTFIDENGKPKVRALKNKNELLDLPDDTQCVGQWRGENRSDFFEFTALQYKQHVENARKRAEEEHKRNAEEEE